MRALVTGATGFVGNRLVLSLLRQGWDIVCLVRRPVVPKDDRVLCIGADLNDLLSFRLCERISGPIDCVFHLAAAMPCADRPLSSYLMANAVATTVLLEAAETWNAQSFVYTSSLLVIGAPQQMPIGRAHPVSPIHPYALGKLCGEQSCEFFRTSGRVATTSLRLTSVFGAGMPHDSVLRLFATQAIRSEDLCYHGTGQRVQNFVHVNDVVQACLLAADHPGAGVLCIGGADSVSMKELAGLIVRLTPKSRSMVRESGRTDPQEDNRWIPDVAEAHAAIGYTPEWGLSAGLSEYIQSLQEPSAPECWWNQPC